MTYTKLVPEAAIAVTYTGYCILTAGTAIKIGVSIAAGNTKSPNVPSVGNFATSVEIVLNLIATVAEPVLVQATKLIWSEVFDVSATAEWAVVPTDKPRVEPPMRKAEVLAIFRQQLWARSFLQYARFAAGIDPMQG